MGVMNPMRIAAVLRAVARQLLDLAAEIEGSCP